MTWPVKECYTSNMKANFILILGFVGMLSCAPLAVAEDTAAEDGAQKTQTITLKDGTVLKGQLKDITDGHYIIDTVNFGQVQILATNVVSITAGNALPQPVSEPSTPQIPNFTNPFGGGQSQLMGQASQMQQSIMGDPQMMAEVQKILGDPEIAAILQDPKVMQDVMSMNPQTIQNNPNIQSLMQNPKMQQLLNLLMQKQGNSSGFPSLPVMQPTP